MLVVASHMKNNVSILKHQGFTLVEVVMSLGVIAFAFVSIMGMLPVGMKLFHEAIDETVASQIVNTVASGVLDTRYSNLSDLSDQVRYFDDQGNEVDDTSALKVYDVHVVVDTATALPGGSDSSNLATIAIQLANNPASLPINAEGSKWAKTSGVTLRTFPIFLARQVN